MEPIRCESNFSNGILKEGATGAEKATAERSELPVSDPDSKVMGVMTGNHSTEEKSSESSEPILDTEKTESNDVIEEKTVAAEPVIPKEGLSKRSTESTNETKTSSLVIKKDEAIDVIDKKNISNAKGNTETLAREITDLEGVVPEIAMEVDEVDKDSSKTIETFGDKVTKTTDKEVKEEPKVAKEVTTPSSEMKDDESLDCEKRLNEMPSPGKKLNDNKDGLTELSLPKEDAFAATETETKKNEDELKMKIKAKNIDESKQNTDSVTKTDKEAIKEVAVPEPVVEEASNSVEKNKNRDDNKQGRKRGNKVPGNLSFTVTTMKNNEEDKKSNVKSSGRTVVKVTKKLTLSEETNLNTEDLSHSKEKHAKSIDEEPVSTPSKRKANSRANNMTKQSVKTLSNKVNQANVSEATPKQSEKVKTPETKSEVIVVQTPPKDSKPPSKRGRPSKTSIKDSVREVNQGEIRMTRARARAAGQSSNVISMNVMESKTPPGKEKKVRFTKAEKEALEEDKAAGVLIGIQEPEEEIDQPISKRKRGGDSLQNPSSKKPRTKAPASSSEGTKSQL